MKRFIEGEDRSQITLFPERLEDCRSQKVGVTQRLSSPTRKLAAIMVAGSSGICRLWVKTSRND